MTLPKSPEKDGDMLVLGSLPFFTWTPETQRNGPLWKETRLVKKSTKRQCRKTHVVQLEILDGFKGDNVCGSL